LTVEEEAVLFGRQGNLVGVMTRPGQPSDLGLVLLSAGLIAKSGMGRLHVQLARRVAAKGVTTLRFDFSSVGDSPARTDHAGVFEIAAQEPSEAIDLLQERGCRRFVLVGLCSGAVAALLAADRDPRVTGVIALNPPPLSADRRLERKGLRQRYLGRSLFSVRAWRNLFSGRADMGRILKALGLSRPAPAVDAEDTPDVQQIIQGLARRGVQQTFVLSEFDKAADHTRMVLAALPEEFRRSGSVQVTTVEGAAHGFLLQSEKDRLLAIVDDCTAVVSPTYS
jgi:pimeloyl-ACP methyl ester carboxylesterase